MIPLATATADPAELNAALRAVMRTCGGDPAIADDVAASVLIFCERHAPLGWWPCECMDALVARALLTVGASGAADRWLNVRLGEARARTWRSVLEPSHALAGEIIFWIAAGLVRLERWDTAQGGRVWSIDVARSRRQAGASLALASLPGLRRVIEQLAPAWDGTQGRGVLVLRGADAEARAAAPEERIPEFARAVLARVARVRNWSRLPDVWILASPCASPSAW